MIVVNLYGGPCSGKSTLAAGLFNHLKHQGVRAELVGEAAKELIYEGRAVQLENQFALAGRQYARLKDLERSGCEVAISDSPLIMQTAYGRDLPYHAKLAELLADLHNSFNNVEIWVSRTKHYDGFGRVQQNITEAKALDSIILSCASPFDYMVFGSVEGQRIICTLIDEHLTMNNTL